MTHDEARVMVSALSDAELDDSGVAALSSHLEACTECTAFSEKVRALSVLARGLPAEVAPAGLADRVRTATTVIPIARPRRRSILAIAAVLGIALVAFLGGLPVPTFRIPAAEAARALQRIKTFTMEREVTDLEAPGGPVVTLERIWFRAPGSLRVERRTGDRVEIEITRPGERYVKRGDVEFREIGLPPDANPVPEPLSPTLALIGRRTGAGPEVAGRKTVRIELSFGPEEKRTALVDAKSFVVLGAERNVIVAKETRDFGRLVETKRTISLAYNPPVSPDLFAIPPVGTIDRRFVAGGLDALAAPPAAIPEGMQLVTAGSGRGGSAALFADGAFGVLVTVDAPQVVSDQAATVRRPTMVAGRPATIVLSLFDLPRVLFEVRGHSIAVAAPLTPEELVALAALLYPGE